MAILNTLHQPQRRPLEPALFVRSLLPKTAVVHAVSCSIIPPHLLNTYVSCPSSTPSYEHSRQLVVATDTSLKLFALDPSTSSLHPLTEAILFTRIVHLATIPSNTPGTDLLIVLTRNSTLSIFSFDTISTRLVVTTTIDLTPPSPLPFKNPTRHHYRLLSVHPTRRLVALAAVESYLSVLSINRNRVASTPVRIPIEGLILALDFLEDDGGDSILLLLLQRGKKQVIALYNVAVAGSSDPSAPPSITYAGVMVTCATALDERAVARATSALTGAAPPSVYTQHAVAITRLQGKPFLFAVFARGRIITGDARAVVSRANADDHVKINDGDEIMTSLKANQQQDQLQQITPTTPTGQPVAEGCPVLRRRTTPNTEQQEQDNDTIDNTAIPVSPPQPVLPLSAMHNISQEQQQSPDPDASQVLTTEDSQHSGMHTPNGSADGSDVETPTASNEGFVTPTQTPTNNMGEPPAVMMPSRRARQPGGNANNPSGGNGREEVPPMPLFTWCFNAGDSTYPRQEDRNSGGPDDYLLYLHVPSYITMEVGADHGMVMSYTTAVQHFREEGNDVNGLYFVMETGALFALKWCDWPRDGTTTFRIPTSDRASSSARVNFNVEYIGDVGPANTIVAMQDRFLFVANDGADGSLRQLQLPTPDNTASPAVRTNRQMLNRRMGSWYSAGRYGLEVKQEFLNLAPISDFAILPPRNVSNSSNEIDPSSSQRNKKRGKRQTKLKQNATAAASVEAQTTDDDEPKSPFIQYLENDPAIVACCGMDSQGSLRFIRPGTPVSLFASSEHQFPACNNMWPIRTSLSSAYDFGIAMSFAQGTGFLVSLPPKNEEDNNEQGTLANLVDGTEAIGIHFRQNTLFLGTLHDGILVQICEDRVRLIQLKQRQDASIPDNIADGRLTLSLCERFVDWFPPEGCFISVGTIGAGYVLICVLPGQESKADLLLLRLDSQQYGLEVVSALPIETELSCAVIPKFGIMGSNSASTIQNDIAVLGTYTPSVEIRLLVPGMPRIESNYTTPWQSLQLKQERSIEKAEHKLETIGKGDYSLISKLRDEDFSYSTDSYASPSKDVILMTAVPESLCPVEYGDMKFVAVGLRDGSVITYHVQSDINTTQSKRDFTSDRHFTLYSHRRLGNRPVILNSALMGINQVIFGLSDRPWICQNIGNRRFEWNPLAFPSTRAVCAYSVLGADRCFVGVGEDGTFYICGMRHREQVSVSSILLKATPRRVINLPGLPDYVMVAVTRPIPKFQTIPHSAFRPLSDVNKPRKRDIYCELRVYNQHTHKLRGHEPLSENEVTRFLTSWYDFVVVGTSFDIKHNENSTSVREIDRGRLILYSVRQKRSRRASGKRRIQFEVVSEVILPGAVSAGAVHPSGEILVVSCNNKIFVFGMTHDGGSLLELARTSTRTPIVSISVLADIICVVDQKDSVAYYQVLNGSAKLERDRSDHQRRDITDTILLNRTIAVAADSHGSLMTIGYEGDDSPTQPEYCKHDWSTALQPRENSYNDDYGVGMETTLGSTHMSLGVGDGETGDASNPTVSTDLGQEYDIIQQEGESDEESENQENIGENILFNSEIEMVETEEGQPATENGTNIQETVVVIGLNGEGTEQQAETIVENDNTEANEDQEMIDQPLIHPSESELPNVTRNSVPRFLIRHNNFDMRDVALRLEHGSFSRYDKIEEREDGSNTGRTNKDNESLLSQTCTGVFCGTLGGAIIVAVPIPEEAYKILEKIQSALIDHPMIVDSTIREDYADYRSLDRTRTERAIDGDLLGQFRFLNMTSKKRICEDIGLVGDQGFLQVEAIVDELIDRIG